MSAMSAISAAPVETGETPLRRFICPRCGKTVDSLATAVSHPCPVAGHRVALRRQHKPRVREEETS